MSKKSNKKGQFSGTALFNGEMTVTIKGKNYKMRVDYLCVDLRRADPDREVILLMKGCVGYNEVTTGYVVHPKGMETGYIGVVPFKGCDSYTVYEIGEVIAWCYADEGVVVGESGCRCADGAEGSEPVKGPILRFREEDGEVKLGIVVGKGKLNDYVTASQKYLAPCLANFIEFRKANPDIVEVNYHTTPSKWEDE